MTKTHGQTIAEWRDKIGALREAAEPKPAPVPKPKLVEFVKKGFSSISLQMREDAREAVHRKFGNVSDLRSVNPRPSHGITEGDIAVNKYLFRTWTAEEMNANLFHPTQYYRLAMGLAQDGSPWWSGNSVWFACITAGGMTDDDIERVVQHIKQIRQQKQQPKPAPQPQPKKKGKTAKTGGEPDGERGSFVPINEDTEMEGILGAIFEKMWAPASSAAKSQSGFKLERARNESYFGGLDVHYEVYHDGAVRHAFAMSYSGAPGRTYVNFISACTSISTWMANRKDVPYTPARTPIQLESRSLGDILAEQELMAVHAETEKRFAAAEARVDEARKKAKAKSRPGGGATAAEKQVFVAQCHRLAQKFELTAEVAEKKGKMIGTIVGKHGHRYVLLYDLAMSQVSTFVYNTAESAKPDWRTKPLTVYGKPEDAGSMWEASIVDLKNEMVGIESRRANAL